MVHLESMGKHSHHGIAGYIKEIGVDTLICGNLGQGAVDSLEAAGITIYAGNTGNCDSAVIKFLHGEMEQNSKANATTSTITTTHKGLIMKFLKQINKKTFLCSPLPE